MNSVSLSFHIDEKSFTMPASSQVSVEAEPPQAKSLWERVKQSVKEFFSEEEEIASVLRSGAPLVGTIPEGRGGEDDESFWRERFLKLEWFYSPGKALRDRVKIRDALGKTLLHKLMEVERLDWKTLQNFKNVLLWVPGEVDQADRYGNTPLYYFLKNSSLFSVDDESFLGVAESFYCVIDSFLRVRASPFTRCEGGKTPLQAAIENMSSNALRKEAISRLLKASAPRGFYPLQELRIALDLMREDVVEMLIERLGLPPKEKWPEFLKSLAEKGNVEMLSLFLGKIPDPKEREKYLHEEVFSSLCEDPSRELFDVSIPDHYLHYATTDEAFKQNQKYYNWACYKAVQEAIRGYRTQKWTVGKVLHFLADARRKIALHLHKRNEKEEREMGVFREGWDGFTTFLAECYKKYKKDAEKLIGKPIIGQTINGEVKLTSFIAIDRGTIGMRHTPSSQHARIREQVTYLTEAFDRGLKEGKLKDVIPFIGEIHWWGAQAAFCKRGSAGLADMYAKFFWGLANYHPPRWLPGDLPDCVAILTPDVKAFAAKYSELFRGDPLPLADKIDWASPERKKRLVAEIREEIARRLEPVFPEENKESLTP